MTRAYIALGSNLETPEEQLRQAVAAIAGLPHSRLEQTSSVYRSPAVGPGVQPDYLNAVISLDTHLTALQLLDHLQSIENRQGRQRQVRWGARTLDLDILLYGQQRIETARLSIPHPAMADRDFVLIPLAEIGGEKLLLPDGIVLGTLIATCADNSLAKTSIRLLDNQTATGSARGTSL